MKKKMMAMAMATVMTTVMLTACGGSDTKVVDKTGDTAQTTTQSTQTEGAAQTTPKGYTFQANGNVEVGVDIPMSTVLDKLGEADSYFEAASCAFDGLNKMYTYAHFEIDTYPDGDQDLISAIYLKDDLVSTKEGLSIGADKAQMESIYGTDYTEKGTECIYENQGMSLRVMITDGKVSYITYASNALDKENAAQ